jgi:hypothetical protein
LSTRDLLRANDARFRALAGGFNADEWSQPSLCDGWSNHDVVAHLVVGYGADRVSSRPRCCVTVDRSTARTQRWPGRWPQHAARANCSTTSDG